MTPERAARIWRAAYLNVLERVAPRHRMLFVRYEDLLDGVGVPALESRLGLELDSGLVRREWNRNGGGPVPDGGSAALPAGTLDVHARLMELRI
jgi:hypothetical protein